MDFKDILGHEKQIEILQKSIRDNSLSHSYLFYGPFGLGKKTLARVFAKTLLCQEGRDTPCNKCRSCLKFDSNNHPDFFEIPGESMIKLEDIGEILKSGDTKPFEAERKIYIIDNSHQMNIESQNALLKTLEEPGDFVNIILISHTRNKLLPTILSRCEPIGFRPIDKEEIIGYLVGKKGLRRDQADFLQSIAGGSLGYSLSLLAWEDFFPLREETLEIVSKVLAGDILTALGSVDFFVENKDHISDLLNLILFYLRDLIIYRELGPDFVVNKDKIDLISKNSSLEYNRINGIINKIEETEINIKNNVNFPLSIETMLLKIQEEEK